MIIILMGVSGSGKTTIGELLSADLGWDYRDGDDFHPPENVKKMSKNIPLNDTDREIWLTRVKNIIDEYEANRKNAVISCSALKESYRVLLAKGCENLQFVFLKGGYELIHRRLEERYGHFMGATLLQTQFDTLEEPTDAVIVDISESPEGIVKTVKNQLF